MEQKIIKVGNVQLGNKMPLALISGPCQIESREHAIFMAGSLVEITQKLGIPYILKPRLIKPTAPQLTVRAVWVWKKVCAHLLKLKSFIQSFRLLPIFMNANNAPLQPNMLICCKFRRFYAGRLIWLWLQQNRQSY